MAWSAKQKRRVHEYARYAGLSDHRYRSILYQHSTGGANSATDERLNERDYDFIMAAIEGELAVAVEAGRMPMPPKKRTFAGDLQHYRRRCPGSSRLSTRQHRRLMDLAGVVCGLISREPGDSGWPFVMEAIRRAVRRRGVGRLEDLSKSEGAIAIDALRGIVCRLTANNRAARVAVQELVD